jgi:hypothetical protein
MNGYRRPFSATVALLLAAAAILGYLAGHSRSNGGSREEMLTLSAANVQLEYPSSWQRSSAAPAIPGLSMADATALAPRGDGAQVGLLVGQLPEGEPSPLPGPFVAQMRQLPDAEVVNLAEIQAYRYAQLSIPGFDRALTIYAIPDPGGEGTVLACYSSARFSDYLRVCQQIVETVTRVGQDQLYELTPEPAYARELSASLGMLNVQRVAVRREMGTRATPATVQRLAARLAEAFASAGASLSALEPPLATHQAQTTLSDSISRAHEAYDALAAATGDESTARFAIARTQVYEAEASVNSALERFALLGYQQR